MSPYLVEIFPDHTNGHNCSAVGPGLSTATSDVETYFTIQARDVFSNPQVHTVVDKFYIQAIRQPIGSLSPIFNETEVAHISESHGQYLVRYTPKASGSYLLRIALLPPIGRHLATSRDTKAHAKVHADFGPRAVWESIASEEIEGSPFVVYVNDGSVSAKTSSAWGISLSHATAGVPALFYVQARDKALNNRSTSGDTVSFEVLSTEDEFKWPAGGYYNVTGEFREYNNDGILATRAIGEVRYVRKGLYRCIYNATKRGNYSISVKIGEEHVIASPFRGLHIAKLCHLQNHAILVAVVSYPQMARMGCLLPALLPGKTSLGTANFTVVARDRFGNRLDRGGDNFLVRLDGPTQLHVVMKDLGKGAYRSEYIVPFNGTYRLSVALVKGYLTEEGGGLRGQYYNVHDFSTVPFMERKDLTVDTELGFDVAAVRWRGLIIPPHNGLWTFYIVSGGEKHLGGHAKMIFNGKVIINGNINAGEYLSGSVPAIGAVPYNVTIEWMRYGEGERPISFEWSGPKLGNLTHTEAGSSKRVVVPASFLAASAEHLPGSPFLIKNINMEEGSEY